MDELIRLDQELFLSLNQLHSDWLDPIMLRLTQTSTWIPLYLLLLILILKNFKANSWMPLLGVLVTLVLADQICSGLMKPYFARLRPSREPALAGMVHIVDGYIGGMYGFASSHASTTFATATFFTFLFRETIPWISLLFIWASLMTYTRIYLGVHYPGDILVGMLVGVASAWIGYKTHVLLSDRFGRSQSMPQP